MDELTVLDMLYQALRERQDPRINDVSYDGDNRTGEIILTTDDGKTKQDWVIRSSAITESERNED